MDETQSAKIIKIILILQIVWESYLYYLQIRKRRWWVREINQDRGRHGFFEKMYMKMKSADENNFFKATRMTTSNFEMLLNLLNERRQRYSRRRPISAEQRLIVTLLFLSRGCDPQFLAWSFKLGLSTTRKIIYETCTAIWEELHHIYLAHPNGNQWKLIAEGFMRKTGMPNCIGAIDGKHINIVCPRRSGSLYFNYKKNHSIVLLAACESNYAFTFVDIGACGSQGIFARSAFGKKILNGSLNIPESENFPFYFVADSAFPLKDNIMRPYPGHNLPTSKDNFNQKLSRARVLIENTFGILANRWRILKNSIYCKPENVDKIVMACVVLHNFLIFHKDNKYFYEELIDHERNGQSFTGEWRAQEPLQSATCFRTRNAPRSALELRNELCTYLQE